MPDVQKTFIGVTVSINRVLCADISARKTGDHRFSVYEGA